MYCLAVQLAVKPERRTEFLECIQNNQRGTLDKELEPLAVVYTYGEDPDTPNTFHFHEEYKGKEGFEAHQKAPHFAVWEKFAATDPFTAPPEVEFFEEIGESKKGKGRGKGKGKGQGYCLNVCLNVKPDRVEDFLKEIKGDQKGTLNDEKLAMSFVIGRDTNVENRFHLYERYVGKAGFEAHLETPHFAEWKKFADGGNFDTEPRVRFYDEAVRATQLKKPKFTTVKSINPESKGVNLMLKCVKCDELEAGKSWSAVLGDATGIVTFSLRDEKHAAVCLPGSSVRIQNARVIVTKGYIAVVVDRFGVMKAAEEPVEEDANSSNDISAIEYELK
jgi:quinol monooxygenase YgiN